MQGPKPISGKRHGNTTIDFDESGFVPEAGDGLTDSWILLPGSGEVGEGEMHKEAKEEEEEEERKRFCKPPPVFVMNLNYSTTCWSYYATIKIIIKNDGAAWSCLII